MLDHAEAILEESGAGAVTVSEIARRMGMKAPSVYKYFASLNDIYDDLFARGQARLAQHLDEAVQGCEPGLERLLEGNRAFLRWSTRELGLASLLFWRPVPGFEPSAESMAAARTVAQRGRAELRAAVERGELAEEADSDEAMRLLTIAVAGVFSQQASNQPGSDFDDGQFTSLTDEVLQMYVNHYRPPERKARP
jgi:AcrR family transcriptional regulator